MLHWICAADLGLVPYPEAFPDDDRPGENLPPARPRDYKQWTICEVTGDQAVKGVCITHGGDACLIEVWWAGR